MCSNTRFSFIQNSLATNPIQFFSCSYQKSQKEPQEELEEEEEGEQEETVSLVSYLRSIFGMPRCLALLCIMNAFAWMAMVSYSLFFTHFVGEEVFAGHAHAPVGSVELQNYRTGVRLASFGLAIATATCSLFSLFLSRLIRVAGEVTRHFRYVLHHEGSQSYLFTHVIGFRMTRSGTSSGPQSTQAANRGLSVSSFVDKEITPSTACSIKIARR